MLARTPVGTGSAGLPVRRPPPVVLWARGVILGLSAMSCCWPDERGNGHCFRRVWWSPGLESINGALRAPRPLPRARGVLSLCSCGAFLRQFYSRAEAQVPHCFGFALRLARGGRRGLRRLAARAGVGQEQKVTPGANMGQSGRPAGLRLWAEDSRLRGRGQPSTRAKRNC